MLFRHLSCSSPLSPASSFSLRTGCAVLNESRQGIAARGFDSRFEAQVTLRARSPQAGQTCCPPVLITTHTDGEARMDARCTESAASLQRHCSAYRSNDCSTGRSSASTRVACAHTAGATHPLLETCTPTFLLCTLDPSHGPALGRRMLRAHFELACTPPDRSQLLNSSTSITLIGYCSQLPRSRGSPAEPFTRRNKDRLQSFTRSPDVEI